MLRTAEFWVLVAFVVFVVLAFKPLRKAVTGALDERAEQIRKQLDEANKLREEAQATLASYKRKQRDALKEAEEIVTHAKAEAERLRAEAAKALE